MERAGYKHSTLLAESGLGSTENGCSASVARKGEGRKAGGEFCGLENTGFLSRGQLPLGSTPLLPRGNVSQILRFFREVRGLGFYLKVPDSQMLADKIGLQVRCGPKWTHGFAASNVAGSPRKHVP